MSLLNFLSAKKYSPKTLELTDLNAVDEDLVAKIFEKELDLILLRNAIPQEVILDIINGLDSIPEKLTFPTPFGTIYGRTLIGSLGEMENYSEVGFELNKFIADTTGHDLNLLSIASIERLMNNKVSLKLANTSGLDYAGYTLKVMSPSKGGLHVHIGSEFLKLLPECKELSEMLKDSHQISFFYVLQAPEKGGELTLFDLDWKSSPPELIDNKNFYSHEEREVFFKKRKRHSIVPKAGDLIVFNGGNVWHKVEDIVGAKNRITFGGFLGKSSSTNDMLFLN